MEWKETVCVSWAICWNFLPGRQAGRSPLVRDDWYLNDRLLWGARDEGRRRGVSLSPCGRRRAGAIGLRGPKGVRRVLGGGADEAEEAVEGSACSSSPSSVCAQRSCRLVFFSSRLRLSSPLRAPLHEGPLHPRSDTFNFADTSSPLCSLFLLQILTNSLNFSYTTL